MAASKLIQTVCLFYPYKILGIKVTMHSIARKLFKSFYCLMGIQDDGDHYFSTYSYYMKFYKHGCHIDKGDENAKESVATPLLNRISRKS